VIAHPTL